MEGFYVGKINDVILCLMTFSFKWSDSAAFLFMILQQHPGRNTVNMRSHGAMFVLLFFLMLLTLIWTTVCTLTFLMVKSPFLMLPMYSIDIHQAFLTNIYHSKTIPQYKIISAREICLDLYLTYRYLNYRQNGLSVADIKNVWLRKAGMTY